MDLIRMEVNALWPLPFWGGGNVNSIIIRPKGQEHKYSGDYYLLDKMFLKKTWNRANTNTERKMYYSLDH